ncbi:hypothetical protein Kpol_388p1 [Vanderwaltozyma polyspora DSM 70294]|uniref:Glycerol uptake/efflux facilitator protein n=1 Tax=Vanderwaltozyma polyspora (strain ATCC 22028 / DSM 70294 / BCRC 21397 / CBS 2163 / NBRC 10782 / NRRL Y-8283 / UCD 57-17) TaxID=436907 RepID=A7TRZ0_VANPO|nr:uncharacterized protein Kpol_388p1 [Vanderwaltozyma polyspora DSM 70294]EDO14958.1 hypothetical protein Kpol_388p1 [Vanderwaltozyma polyspora DSM 70294]
MKPSNQDESVKDSANNNNEEKVRDQNQSSANHHHHNSNHENFDYERQQEYNYQYSNLATTYIPQYTIDGSYPIQEVVPNTQMAMSGADSAFNRDGDNASNLRQRAKTPVASNVLDVGDFYRNADDGQANTNQQGEGNGYDDFSPDPRNVPLMVKPKTLYQNPQTPTVLPSTYHPINRWSSIKHTYLKEFLAEFLGTMFLVIFGDAVSAQVGLGAKAQQDQFAKTLANLEAAGIITSDQIQIFTSFEDIINSQGAGTFDAIPFGWAAAVVMGYFAAGGSAISGAHLNPAVTVSNFIYRGLPLKKVPIYIAGQLLGGFLGGLIVFAYYKKVIKETFPDWRSNQSVASMFCTFPQAYLSTARQVVSEFVNTAMFQASLFALTDPYTSLSTDIFPVMLFFLIYILNASMSYQTACAINLARDMGPRLAIYVVGFKRALIWDFHHHYFWVPMIVPFIGATFGGLVYDICIYQGHESPVNWPLSIYKEKFLRTWHRRPGWKARSRERATSELSDFSYNDNDSQIGDQKLKPARTRTKSNGSSADDSKQKSVQFRPVQRGKGYGNGVPTILEEGDSIETASLGGASHASVMLTDGSSSPETVKDSNEKN